MKCVEKKLAFEQAAAISVAFAPSVSLLLFISKKQFLPILFVLFYRMVIFLVYNICFYSPEGQ